VMVADRPTGPVDDQQPRLVAPPRRLLGDQVRWQVIVEESGGKRRHGVK
jgi:hypothetical protein